MWVFIFLLSLAICFIRWIFWTVFSKPYRSLQFTLCVCVCVMRALSLNRVWFFYNPMDCILPGSSVHRILQARILEWVAISSARAFSHPRDWTHVSCVSCIGRQISFYHWATWEAFTRRILKTRKWRKVFQIPLISFYLFFSAAFYLSVVLKRRKQKESPKKLSHTLTNNSSHDKHMWSPSKLKISQYTIK